MSSGIFAPPVHDTEFCAVVLRVLPATGHAFPIRPEEQSLYVCTKPMPCPDHPQGSLK